LRRSYSRYIEASRQHVDVYVQRPERNALRDLRV